MKAFGVEIYWDEKSMSCELVGDPDLREATNRCLNAAISILVNSGDSEIIAKKKIISGLVNSLQTESAA